MIGDRDIIAVRRAFETGHPNARERAAWLREMIVMELGPLLESANEQLAKQEEWLAMAEAGIDWFCEPTKRGAPLAFKSPLHEAAACLDRFIEVEARARDLLAKMSEIDTLIGDHDGPTIEYMRQVSKSRAGDPLLRLLALGRITMDDLMTAREIAGVVRHMTNPLGVKAINLPVKIDIGADEEPPKYTAAETAEWYSRLLTFVYLPWADRVRKDLPLIHAVVLDGVALGALRKRYHIGYDTALRKVKDALKQYREMRRDYLRYGPTANPRVPRTDAGYASAAR